MITHDLGVVAEVADHVVVMYAAKSCRTGSRGCAVRPPRAPVYLGPHAIASADRNRGRASRADSRTAALAAQPAERVPFPPQVPVRVRPLQPRDAGAPASPADPAHARACFLTSRPDLSRGRPLGGHCSAQGSAPPVGHAAAATRTSLRTAAATGAPAPAPHADTLLSVEG